MIYSLKGQKMDLRSLVLYVGKILACFCKFVIIIDYNFALNRIWLGYGVHD